MCNERGIEIKVPSCPETTSPSHSILNFKLNCNPTDSCSIDTARKTNEVLWLSAPACHGSACVSGSSVIQSYPVCASWAANLNSFAFAATGGTMRNISDCGKRRRVKNSDECLFDYTNVCAISCPVNRMICLFSFDGKLAFFPLFPR